MKIDTENKKTHLSMIPIKTPNGPQIAISSRVDHQTQSLIDFARQHHFSAIEYTIKAENTHHLKKEASFIGALVRSGLDVRYHAPFKTIELSHKDKTYAEKSLRYLKECLDMLADYGAHYIVVHLGFGFRFSLHELLYSHALKYLSDVVAYGTKRNIIVCLENLTYGWTNNPQTLLELIQKSGAYATIDIGHVSASPLVVDKKLSGDEFIRTMAPHIASAHVYQVENFDYESMTPYHVAPKDLTMIQPLLTELLHTDCNWWLIELGDKSEILETRRLLMRFLSICGLKNLCV